MGLTTAEMDLIMWNKEPWLKLESWHFERKFTQHHVSHGSIYLKWKIVLGEHSLKMSAL